VDITEMKVGCEDGRWVNPLPANVENMVSSE